jgi:hypothetical protein
MKTVLQVLVGLVLCVGIGAVLIYSSLPIFWEHEEPLQGKRKSKRMAIAMAAVQPKPRG